MIRTMAKNCQQSENASAADMEEMVVRDMPTTPASKCLRACMMESLSLVSQTLILCFTRVMCFILNILIDTKWKAVSGGQH